MEKESPLSLKGRVNGHRDQRGCNYSMQSGFFLSCKCILLLTLRTRMKLEAGQIILHVGADGFSTHPATAKHVNKCTQKGMNWTVQEV